MPSPFDDDYDGCYPCPLDGGDELDEMMEEWNEQEERELEET